MPIRRARTADVPCIQRLIGGFADQNRMLHRSLSELYENLRDFYVWDEDGQVVGCVALHVDWEDMAELRSLAVYPDYHGRGIGRQLVAKVLDEAVELGLQTVYTLTLEPEFFGRAGFQRGDVSKLPRKVWQECFRCPKFLNCDEIAMVYPVPVGDAPPAFDDLPLPLELAMARHADRAPSP